MITTQSEHTYAGDNCNNHGNHGLSRIVVPLIGERGGTKNGIYPQIALCPPSLVSLNIETEASKQWTENSSPTQSVPLN
jgi:hypothetical protein